MAAALKAEGNALFARKEWDRALSRYTEALELVDEADVVAKTSLLSNRSACYIHLNQFDKALVDGNLCIKLRPEWSKSYARCAEAYSRQNNFRLSAFAYGEAIRTAEDETTKTRYLAAQKLAREGLTRAKTVVFKSSADSALSRVYHQTWFQRFLYLEEHGSLKKTEGGGLEMLALAWNYAAEGWLSIDAALESKVDGEYCGRHGSSAIRELSESILIDHEAFAVPQGGQRDPRYTFMDKFLNLAEFEWKSMGLFRYFSGRIWTAREIVLDLEAERVNGLTWEAVRVMALTLIRGGVLTAFVKTTLNHHPEAIEHLSLSIELINEGNRIWKDVSYANKGTSFKPTVLRMIKAEAMRYRLEANQMASTTSAKVAFSLEAIERAAREIIAENPQNAWVNTFDNNPREPRWTRLAFFVLPSVRAYSALGFCSAERARVPIDPFNLEPRTVATADIEHAKKAARFYDLAFKLLPDDYYGKPSIGFKALQQHLLAGGKTVRQVFELAKEAEKIRQTLLPIFTELDQEEPARSFVEARVEALQAWLVSPEAKPLKGVAPINLVLKAVPTINCGLNPEAFDENTVLTPSFWESLPGDVAIVIKSQLIARSTQPTR